MKEIIKEEISGMKFELLIDTKIYKKNIILKAAYTFLDKGYFYFEKDENGNILLQFTKREEIEEKPKNILGDFLDELLSVKLRDKLEKENKEIREAIVAAAISSCLDEKNFKAIEPNAPQNENENEIDFDKDIDDILKEIENDPDLKIDEEEIEKILKEIEDENEESLQEEINLDINAVEEAKKKFKN